MAFPIKQIAPLLGSASLRPFTEAELMFEVGEAMEGVWQLIYAILGRRTVEDIPTPGAQTQAAYMRDAASMAYRYAFEGVLPGNRDADAEFLDLTAFTLTARNAAELYGEVVPLSLEQTMATAILRKRLDDETIGEQFHVVVLEPDEVNFTLFEIAVLARMNEKSVRNATQPTSKDRLMTIKVGNRTLVEPHEALRWLKGRRGFKSTCLSED